MSERGDELSDVLSDLEASAEPIGGRVRRNRADRQLPVHRGPGSVVITDVRMPFWSMVVFMVKWTLASIPAALILFALYFAVLSAFVGTGVAVARITGSSSPVEDAGR